MLLERRGDLEHLVPVLLEDHLGAVVQLLEQALDPGSHPLQDVGAGIRGAEPSLAHGGE